MRTLALVLAAALNAWPAAAQRAETGAPAFGETVDVQLVNVEVWVTDRQGEPVTGLGIGDFEVREDGKVVEISNFAEIRDSPAGDPFAPTDPIEAPTEAPARQPALELENLLEKREEQQPAPGTGVLALYFDELFSKPGGRQQLIEDLRTFLELRRVPPERVLILRQDRGLEVEANLGSSRAQLEAALDRLEEPFHPRHPDLGRREERVCARLHGGMGSLTVTVAVRATVPVTTGIPANSFPRARRSDLIQFHINSSRGPHRRDPRVSHRHRRLPRRPARAQDA